MSTFAPNSVVTYNGDSFALKAHSAVGFSVVEVIPDGKPIGNGEVNHSGENIIRCKSLYSGLSFIFRESELKQN